MLDCSCDVELPSFSSERTPKARKIHRCYECAVEIQPGETYRAHAGKWDGEVQTYKMCSRCSDILMWTRNNFPCFCWTYGQIISDAQECVRYAAEVSGPEVRGLYFGLLRLLLKREIARGKRSPRVKNAVDSSETRTD